MDKVLHESQVLKDVFKEGFHLEQVKFWRGQRRNLAFYTESIGELRVTTGKIVADDPYSLIESTPFVQEFPQGSFKVELAIARITDPQSTHEIVADERVAFARIVFSDAPVATWKGAEREFSPEVDPNHLDEQARWGFAVDSGTGSYLDARGYYWLAEQQELDDPQLAQDLMDAWETAAMETFRPNRSWLMTELQTGDNMALFSSGFGNGVYHSYIGYAADGSCAQLVTDFNVYPD
ncbi:DUF4241 domain-containing protein [Paenibacillus campi]|uniref:DUF4241 domain-containing protein n=1 Tax=Paenibacillus campi TaxID=3106031 RepID=UPI002B002B06|nr:DUF4241 domain-containing protein [Paenibacillus sp. SGZ-1014]